MNFAKRNKNNYELMASMIFTSKGDMIEMSNKNYELKNVLKDLPTKSWVVTIHNSKHKNGEHYDLGSFMDCAGNYFIHCDKCTCSLFVWDYTKKV